MNDIEKKCQEIKEKLAREAGLQDQLPGCKNEQGGMGVPKTKVGWDVTNWDLSNKVTQPTTIIDNDFKKWATKFDLFPCLNADGSPPMSQVGETKMDDSDKMGPCRESAQNMLKQRIESLRRKADGYEALLIMLGEKSGLAEEVVYELLIKDFYGG